MSRQSKAILASVSAIAVAAVVLSMLSKNTTDSAIAPEPTAASVVGTPAAVAPNVDALPSAIQGAGLRIGELKVINVDGVVILRGNAPDRETITRTGDLVKRLGHARVANLLQVSAEIGDDTIKRDAERELSLSRSLDDCKFAVSAKDGVVTVSGTVRTAYQEDTARSIVKQVPGVRSVRTEFVR